MALGVLNNINAIYAQNNLANTQASLSKTLQQLSSGSRINSGADDAAGLSLANGLQASSTALSQSAKNATEGVDFLQVADGALSQVTSLLNRAVTLATEASNGTLNSSQVSAANSEYQKILTEADTINNNTEYNGINTFAKNAAFTVGKSTDKIDVGALATDIATVTYGTQTLKLENSGSGNASTTGVIASGATGIYTVGAGTDTLATLAGQINSQFGASVASVQGSQLVLSGGAKLTGTIANLTDTLQVPTTASGGTASLTVGNASDTLTVGSTDLKFTTTGGAAVSITNFAAAGTGNLYQLAAQINTQFGSSGADATVSANTLNVKGGTISAAAGDVTESGIANSKANQTVAIFTSDGTISQSYNNASSDMVQASSSALSLAGTDLTSTAGAQAALTAINSAITTVAAARGTLGANINTLTAVGNVMTMQSTNTLAAMNDVTATDYGQATSDMSKFQILSQTGIAALSQANQAQQLITKLLQ